MIDSFALLEQPRRPWLDADLLKDAFHRLASLNHPDRAEGRGDFSINLNAAFITLRDPVKRLRHFLELEDPAALRRSQVIPADLADFFSQVVTARQELAGFAARRRAAGSAVARALLVDEENAVKARAGETQSLVEKQLADALEELRATSARWPSPGISEELARLYTRLAYLSRWDEQLRESALQSALA